MTASAFDIAILGAGPVGRVLALMLARVAPDPARIALQGTAPPPRRTPRRGRSSRAGHEPRQPRAARIAGRLAGTLGRHPQHPCPQRGRLGRSLIRHTDFDVPQLGSVVGYSPLRPARSPRRPVRRDPVGTARPDPGAGRRRRARRPGRHRIALPGGGAVRRRGRRGPAPRLRPARRADHGARRPAAPGWAWERFTSEGPLALLPHPHTPEAHSVVWCSTPQRAAELVALDNAAFSRALSAAFGDRLGRLSSQAPRHVFRWR